MSRIADMAKEMKTMKDHGEWKEGQKKTVTVRLDEFGLFCLDFFVSQVGGNRTSNSTELVSEGALEGLEALGFTLDDLQAKFISEKSGKNLDEVKADLAKTGIEVKNV